MISLIKNKVLKRRYGRFYLKNTLIHNFNKKLIKLYLKRQRDNIEKIKREYGVNQIYIGHFHFDRFRREMGLKIFDAYVYKGRIYITRFGYIITDVHLGLIKYNIVELMPIFNIIKSGERIIILGDLTEHTRSLYEYTLAEKYLLNLILDGVERGKIIYLRGNHDSCIFKNRRKEFVVIDDTLFIHGDIFLKDPRKPKC